MGGSDAGIANGPVAPTVNSVSRTALWLIGAVVLSTNRICAVVPAANIAVARRVPLPSDAVDPRATWNGADEPQVISVPAWS